MDGSSGDRSVGSPGPTPRTDREAAPPGPVDLFDGRPGGVRRPLAPALESLRPPVPAHGRSFDLLLLVDDTVTARVWREHMDWIMAEAERSGVFHRVRSARLDFPQQLDAAIALPGSGEAIGSPSEPEPPTGPSMHLVLTDGLAAAWASAAADTLLRRLGAAGPTAVVDLLPTHLWHRSSLAPHRAHLSAAGFGSPNTDLGYERTYELAGGAEADRGLPEDCLPVPVLSYKQESLATWARLVSGDAGVRPVLPVVTVGRLARQRATLGLRTPRIGNRGDAAAVLRRFAALATPAARQLAALLAAAPFEVDHLLELQGALVPEAGPAELSEVLMGGLIDWGGSGRRRPDFAPGVREALLATSTRTELVRVVNRLAGLPATRVMGRALRAALADPLSAPLPSADAPWRPVEVAVLKALSGPYAERALRMSTASESSTLSGGFGPGSVRRPPARSNPLTPVQDTAGAPVPQSPNAAVDVREADPAMESALSEPRAARPQQPVIMGNVPPKNPNFVGRDDLLAAVESRLRADETAAVLPHALHGMGGVGKSQIAIEYVYRHSHEYNVIWWIPAEHESLILGSLTDLARSLKLNVGTQANTAVPAVQEALRTGYPYDNWLLVFDNAESIETVRSYFPTGGPGKIIITSRNREWERVASPLTVDVFRREESIALLQRRARDLSIPEADSLAEALGDLPLAVEQAAAWHAATGMPVAEYLDLLARRQPGILELDPSPDYPIPVAAAWDISLERLAQENPAARELLQICACMAPEPVPLNLLRGSRNVEISERLDPVLRNPVALARATRELSKLSLVRLDHRSNTLQMHRLMQTVLSVGVTPEAVETSRNAAQVLLAAAKPGAPEAPGEWPAYQAMLPHVLASGAVRSADPWVRELTYAVCFYLYYWGAHDTAVEVAREAWTAWSAQSDESDLHVLRMGKFLGFMLRFLGEYEEAFALNLRALEVSRETDVPEDELIDSMWQMAGALRNAGRFADALALDREADSQARDLFGPEDPATLLAAHSLAVSLRACGNFREAEGLDAATLEQWEVLYGPTNALTLNTRGGLSVDIREGGDYLRALNLQEATYQTYCEAFGERHPATLRGARNLAVCRRRAGDIEGAGELTEEVLARFRDRYGPDFTDTLATAANAVVDRRLRGDLDGSRSLGEDTLERYRATRGPDHAHTLSAMVNLAATLRALGEVGGAEKLDTEALARFRATLGERHVSTLTTALARASDHYARLEFEAAEQLDGETLAALREVVGPDHPVTFSCQANLALDLRGLGRSSDADVHNTQAVEGLSRVLGSDHPWTVAARLHLRIESDVSAMAL